MNFKTIEYLKSKQLICIKLLGKGVFSEQVILAEHEISKTQYAIKVLNHSKSQFKLIQSEIDILHSLSHPNIIQYFKAFFNDNKVYLVMEYVKGGDISSNLPQTPKERHQFFKHLILAVQYLHQNNIIHCDLKFENILIANPGDYTSIKIIDFGLSFKFQENEDKKNYIYSDLRQFGTPYYMAPELFNNAIYSKEIDIWSCGIILYYLQFNGEHPFIIKGDKFADIKQKLKNPVFQKLHSEDKTENELQIYDLIKKMTKKEPEERYTASQILQHSWITSESKESPLTAFEIRQAFVTQDKFQNVLSAMLFMQYSMAMNKKIVASLKPIIKIKSPKRNKPSTMHELVQHLLATINSINTTNDQLSADRSPSKHDSSEGLQYKNTVCSKIKESKNYSQPKYQISQQFQKPHKFQLKTKMLQKKIQSTDLMPSDQNKPFFQRRQNSGKILPTICQTKKLGNYFSSTELSTNSIIFNQPNIISARLSTINNISHKKFDQPFQKFCAQQKQKNSTIQEVKQSPINAHYKRQSFQIHSKNVSNFINQNFK